MERSNACRYTKVVNFPYIGILFIGAHIENKNPECDPVELLSLIVDNDAIFIYN